MVWELGAGSWGLGTGGWELGTGGRGLVSGFGNLVVNLIANFVEFCGESDDQV